MFTVNFLLLGAVLFCTGVFGVIARKNAVMVLMSVELILNAVNLNLIAFALMRGNVDGQVFALDNTCTHRGGPLAEGEVSGHEVTCPWHGATFDVRTGEVVGPPAQRAVARYGVRVTGTNIEVEL